MNITDILIMPWKNSQIGETVLNFTLLVLLLVACPVLYIILNKNLHIKERIFNCYLLYVLVPVVSVVSMEIFFWPVATLLNSVFLLALFDKESAKGICYREKNGLGFRSYELKNKKYYDKSVQYSREELKKYLPNPIIYCFLLYFFPVFVMCLLCVFGLGYILWV